MDCASGAELVDEGFPASGESSQSLCVRRVYQGDDFANDLCGQTMQGISIARHFGGLCQCFMVCASGFHLG